MTDAPLWWLTLDGDRDCLALLNSGQRRIMGGGEKLLLRTREGDAALGWRKIVNATGQASVYCAVFRNESQYEAAELIRQADRIADCAWPDCRHYATIDAGGVGADDDGLCFSDAGWKRLASGKGRLITFERIAPQSNGKTRYDTEIRAMIGAGKTHAQVAEMLGVHKWIVDDACKRLNLSKRNELHESPIKYNKRPLVQKTCPMCRKKHMSDPAIWTCAECKELQDRENTGGCGDWY